MACDSWPHPAGHLCISPQILAGKPCAHMCKVGSV
uniref:Uncharacterized protein n=1 Tax=Anguilla anguilla TaxID=7936 RepID=A0A0E9UQD6_ANGAN